MRTFTSLLLASAVSAAAVHRLDERQLGLEGLAGGVASALMPKLKAIKIEDVPPQLNIPGAKRMRLLYGPFKLRAANSTTKTGNGISMDKGGTGYSYMMDSDFPKDITTLGTEASVLDEKYKRAETKDGIYNHHVVFLDLTTPPPPPFACEGNKAAPYAGPSVYMGGATEMLKFKFAAQGGNIKSGYYLPKDRRVMHMVDVINYNNVERTVYVQSEIEYLPGKQPGYLEVRQARVDPGLCGGPNGTQIHAPVGQTKFSVNSTGIVAARDGYMVNMRGHVHDGGIDIVLKVNDKEVCVSKATYGGEGYTSTTADGQVWETIRETSTCDEPVKITKGDKIYMEAHYDTVLHPAREQGGGHGGKGGHGGMRRFPDTFADGGEMAEQMALMITYFAYAK